MTYARFQPILLFALLLIVSISCEPTYFARINNKTNNEIVLELQFDKSDFQEVWGSSSFLPYLQRKVQDGGELLRFDTIALISKTLLKPNEFFTIQQAIGVRPDFFGIKKIQIFKNDTIILDSKESIIKAFKETKTRNFNFDIK